MKLFTLLTFDHFLRLDARRFACNFFLSEFVIYFYIKAFLSVYVSLIGFSLGIAGLIALLIARFAFLAALRACLVICCETTTANYPDSSQISSITCSCISVGNFFSNSPITNLLISPASNAIFSKNLTSEASPGSHVIAFDTRVHGSELLRY